MIGLHAIIQLLQHYSTPLIDSINKKHSNNNLNQWSCSQCIPLRHSKESAGNGEVWNYPTQISPFKIFNLKISTHKKVKKICADHHFHHEISLQCRYGNHQYVATTRYFSVALKTKHLCTIIRLLLCDDNVCPASEAAASYLPGNIIVNGRSTVHHFNLNDSLQTIPALQYTT